MLVGIGTKNLRSVYKGKIIQLKSKTFCVRAIILTIPESGDVTYTRI